MGVSTHTHAELPHFAGELNKLERVSKVRRCAVVVLGEVAPERHDVHHPGVEVVLQEIAHLVSAMPDADEMGHRRQLARLLNSRDEIERPLSRLATSSVRHGDERGIEHLQVAERSLEHCRFVVRFGRKELEGSRPSAS